MKVTEIVESVNPGWFRKLRIEFESEHNTEHDDFDYGDEPDWSAMDEGPTLFKNYNIVDPKGNVVGKLDWDNFWGVGTGYLYNKHLPKLDPWGHGGDGDEKDVQAVFDRFLQSKTFRKWSSNIDKYRPLKGPTNDYRLKTNKV